MVGKPKVPGIMLGLDQREMYVGNEALKRRGVLHLSSPVKDAYVRDWVDMDQVLMHLFF